MFKIKNKTVTMTQRTNVICDKCKKHDHYFDIECSPHNFEQLEDNLYSIRTSVSITKASVYELQDCEVYSIHLCKECLCDLIYGNGLSFFDAHNGKPVSREDI